MNAKRRSIMEAHELSGSKTAQEWLAQIAEQLGMHAKSIREHMTVLTFRNSDIKVLLQQAEKGNTQAMSELIDRT